MYIADVIYIFIFVNFRFFLNFGQMLIGPSIGERVWLRDSEQLFKLLPIIRAALCDLVM